MTYIISNDPAWWSTISYVRFVSYFVVASIVVVVYDWALTFAQEFELIWRQHWSFMTVLYICVRYIGILFSLTYLLWVLPVSLPDMGCNILYFVVTWVPVVVNAMLGVIMMIRIHVMYGRSSKLLIFLAVLLLVSTIATGIGIAISNLGYSGGEVVLSGYHMCIFYVDTSENGLNNQMIISTTTWEILVFFLAVWIAVKHFRELRQLHRGSTVGDCFTVLIQSHTLYFLAFAVMACVALGSLSPTLMYSNTLGAAVYVGVYSIAQVFQMCVLGPRLIFSVRDYNAKLVARSDEGTHMTSIAFQACGGALAGGDTLTGGDVLTSEDV